MAKKRNGGKGLPLHHHGMAPTKERQRQNGGVVTEAIHEKNDGITYIRRHRARFECVLDAYLWHGHISNAQYEAGLKFRREYQRAVLRIKVYDNNSGSRGDTEMPFISAINSNQVLQEAFQLLSLRHREIVIMVCGDNYRAATTRKIKYLNQALQVLAIHWKFLAG